MEALATNIRASCASVTVVVLELDATRGAPSEQALTDRGLPTTCYTLGSNPMRYSYDPLELVRWFATEAARIAPDGYEAVTVPCFRPCVVASVKHLMEPDCAHRFRLTFDLDPLNGSPDEPPLGPPDGAALLEAVRTWALRWLEYDIYGTNGCLSYGEFADKPRSAHLVLADVHLEPKPSNHYKDNPEAFAALNASLAPFGFTADPSITRSGIKYPFFDKFIKGRWRGAVMRPLFVFAPGFDPMRFSSWTQLFGLTSPIAVRGTRAYAKGVSFIARPARVVPDAVRMLLPVAAPAAAANGNTVEERILTAVPAWRGVPCRRVQGHAGSVVLVFDSTHCPLKTEPTDDAPALQHAGRGKCYVLVDALENATIRCQICKREMRFASVVPAGADYVIEQMNQRFAKVQNGNVLVLPLKLDDGSYTSYRVIRKADFLGQYERSDQIVRVGKRDVSWCAFWYISRFARSYECGVACDPLGRLSRQFYNSWCGFPAPLIAASAELQNASDDELAEMCAVFLQHVEVNITSGDRELAVYVLNWIAYMFQQPGLKPMTALVLIGDPGCGKGIFARMLMHIVGPIYSAEVASQDITNNWTASIMDKVLLFVDEAHPGQREVTGLAQIKSLITETSMVRRQRYHDEVSVNTFQHLVIASNDNNAVHVQRGERRYVALPCRYGVAARNTPEELLFRSQLVEQVEHDARARAAFYTLCMRRNLSNWQSTIAPATRTLWTLQYESMMPTERFVYAVLCSGDLLLSPIDTMELYDGVALPDHPGFDLWSSEAHMLPRSFMGLAFAQRYPNSRVQEAQVWQAWYALVPRDSPLWVNATPSVKRRAIDHGNAVAAAVAPTRSRVKMFAFPPLQTLRTAFVNHAGNVDDRIWTEWRCE